MTDDELKQWFSQQDDAPDSGAKARAMAAALQAFDQAQAIEGEKKAEADQGSGAIHRLTSDNNTVGSNTMNQTVATPPSGAGPSNRRWIYSGLASAAVLVLGVFIAVQVPQHSGYEDTGRHLSDMKAAKEKSLSQPSLHLEEVIVTARKREDTAEIRPQRQIAQVDNFAMDMGRAMPEMAAAPQALMAESKVSPGFAADMSLPPGYQDSGRDRFESVTPNPIQKVAQQPVSTFSIDVDTSAYSFVRRQLNQGVLPQKAAVRLEEMVNYFPYAYPLPGDTQQPFSTHITVLDSPWKAGNKLVHIGIQGYELQGAQPRANLVFLLDVSGSMNSADKLPLVKQSMNLLLSRLQPEDTVAIVVYAGAAGTVLEPTAVKDKQKILAALNRLNAGGSTAGAAGIELAYQLAEAHFIEDGVNRIVLATDGDFNVGINNHEELKGFVERKRESGVYLSVLGFGQGNYHDQLMQALAQHGNGVAAYIDTLSEAQKVLVDEASANLFPIARDVKIQVEFNPATVSEYRLLGYETRQLAEEDFNNDAVDAGDIGAGHAVTAIYEITPVGNDSGVFNPSRYTQQPVSDSKASEYGFLQLRYKLPNEERSRLIQQPIASDGQSSPELLREARFATAVAGFAQLLQGGKYTGEWDYPQALALAQANRGEDAYGYRAEFVQLIRKAQVADAL